MARRKSTLRKMLPMQRALATLSDDLKSVARRIDNLLPKIAELEEKAEKYKIISDQTMERLAPETKKK